MRADGERAARFGREPREVGHPAQDAALERGRRGRQLRDGERLVQRGDDRLGPDGRRQRARELVRHVLGSCSQAAFGMTSPSTRASTSANGRPLAGAGSSNSACTSACGGGTGVWPGAGGREVARDDAGERLAGLRRGVGEDVVERRHAAQPRAAGSRRARARATVTSPRPSLPSSSRRPAGVPVSAGNVPQWPPTTSLHAEQPHGVGRLQRAPSCRSRRWGGWPGRAGTSRRSAPCRQCTAVSPAW